jgi:hypothetical protein
MLFLKPARENLSCNFWSLALASNLSHSLVWRCIIPTLPSIMEQSSSSQVSLSSLGGSAHNFVCFQIPLLIMILFMLDYHPSYRYYLNLITSAKALYPNKFRLIVARD